MCLLLAVDGLFGLGIVAGLPLTILLWIDLGRELRTLPGKNRGSRAAGLLMGIPQALFGVLCLAVGLAIICWVLYNSLWRRDPNYSGGWLSFGIAPLLSLFGAGLTVDAFKIASVGTSIDHGGGDPSDAHGSNP